MDDPNGYTGEIALLVRVHGPEYGEIECAVVTITPERAAYYLQLIHEVQALETKYPDVHRLVIRDYCPTFYSFVPESLHSEILDMEGYRALTAAEAVAFKVVEPASGMAGLTARIAKEDIFWSCYDKYSSFEYESDYIIRETLEEIANGKAVTTLT